MKLLFPKVLRKESSGSSDLKKSHNLFNFYFSLLSSFGKSNLTHLTTDVMYSGQRFAILAMFFFIDKSCILLKFCIGPNIRIGREAGVSRMRMRISSQTAPHFMLKMIFKLFVFI